MKFDWEKIENDYKIKLWKKVGEAIGKFEMIEKGDKIGIGVSGGKDSLVLAVALKRLQNIAPINFSLKAYIVNPGIDDFEKKGDKLFTYLEELGIELKIVNSNILEIVFEDKKVKNPCFLCSRLRRGILYRELKKDGMNVLALGHHMEDHVETFLLNLFFSGSTRPMPPCYYSGKHKLKIIRPLALVKESDILDFQEEFKLPVVNFACLLEKDVVLQRKEIKKLLNGIEERYPEVKNSIFWASQKLESKKRRKR